MTKDRLAALKAAQGDDDVAVSVEDTRGSGFMEEFFAENHSHRTLFPVLIRSDSWTAEFLDPGDSWIVCFDSDFSSILLPLNK
ncbi:hypothetical protein CDAR_11301 [Caerostris darwini]|uniref:Uncharacterized protein n=1 Tax=Caerostris darwini TaxID=1538125 RepID=A0AAV4R8G5_9ARAC|nr:hypothetical protein CDAR_11301 [Caerostris darwini]